MSGEEFGAPFGGGEDEAATALSASKGSFTVSGKAAGLLHHHVLTAAKGAFVLSGKAATLSRNRILTADKGAFVVFGYAAGPHGFFADTVSFAVSGKDATFRRGRTLTAAKGAFAVLGKAATLARSRSLAANKGAFVVSVRPAGLVIGTTKFDLITALLVRESIFTLELDQDFRQLGSGSTQGVDRRPELWRATLRTPVMEHGDTSGIEALIEVLRGLRGSVYLWNPKKQYPRLDPDGSILGASTVTILAVDGSQNLRLTGLPAGYILSPGDFLSFDYGSPTRRAFHQVTRTATADALGRTDTVNLRPHLVTGVTAGLAVTLVRPSAEMLIPAFGENQISTLLDAVEIEAVQVHP